jgi:hypothetical protein
VEQKQQILADVPGYAAHAESWEILFGSRTG